MHCAAIKILCIFLVLFKYIIIVNALKSEAY